MCNLQAVSPPYACISNQPAGAAADLVAEAGAAACWAAAAGAGAAAGWLLPAPLSKGTAVKRKGGRAYESVWKKGDCCKEEGRAGRSKVSETAAETSAAV